MVGNRVTSPASRTLMLVPSTSTWTTWPTCTPSAVTRLRVASPGNGPDGGRWATASEVYTGPTLKPACAFPVRKVTTRPGPPAADVGRGRRGGRAVGDG